ncbi:MAG TPA: response regulator, partial [Methanocorpusculum sp.]|nr:response regulator [Methanocorpusculum sp.]
RSSDGHYCEMKFVKVNGEAEAPTAVALGFADKDEEIRAAREAEFEQKRYYAVIKALSSEYASIYFADLEQNIVLPYSSSDRIKDKFGADAFEHLSFDAAVRNYVTKACSANDRRALSEALSPHYMRRQLALHPYYKLTYLNDEDKYCEMKCVRTDETGDVVSVVIGFAEKDEEIRAREQAERETQRNFDIIQVLASEYSSVYYIDLTTDELDPYTMNEDTESEFGQIFKSGIHYSQAYRMYVDRLILPEDRKMMLKAGSLPNIMTQLAYKKTFITTYRSAEGHYCEMKFVKVNGENELPSAVALGFADKDEVLRKEEEIRSEQERNFDIIQILASEYSSVYYIDLSTDGLTPYTMNADTESEFGQIFKSGIQYSDAYRMYVDRLIHADDKEMMLKAGSIYNIVRQLTDKKTFITTYRSADGHYCEMKFVKVNGENEAPTAVALGFADKDEEIRGEQIRKIQLEDARSKAEAASKAKSTFLFNMSHDIRTPMNAILGFASMAKKHLEDKERVQDYLNKVLAAGDHLLMLINDVLDMSRIESGKVTINEKTTDVVDAGERLVAIVRESAVANSIDLVHIADVTDRVVYADELHVNQIVLNIISNAIKYTRTGGKVTYTLSQISPSVNGHAKYKMQVEDTGIGMTQEFVDHIFEEFSREKNTTVSGIQGTGLGMSIVRRLVDLMEGSIDIQSQVGVGTKVTVILDFRTVASAREKQLPAEADAAAEAAAAPKPAPVFSLEGKRVLVVEDRDLNREIARDMLEECKIIVDEVEDGSFAVEKLKSMGPLAYDCVLMDIQMPYMDGYKATQIIRKMPGFEKLPIIALSANAFEEDKHKSLEAGMNAHLSKPINADELVKVLIQVMKGEE